MSIKKLNAISLISILLRIEIGLPFILFRFPLNIAIGLGFSIINYFSEKQYLAVMNLRQRIISLAKMCSINAVLLAAGWIIHCNFTYLSNGERKFDYDKIYAVILLSVLIPVCMIFFRLVLCLIDTWKTPPENRNNDELMDIK